MLLNGTYKLIDTNYKSIQLFDFTIYNVTTSIKLNIYNIKFKIISTNIYDFLIWYKFNRKQCFHRLV